MLLDGPNDTYELVEPPRRSKYNILKILNPFITLLNFFRQLAFRTVPIIRKK